MDLVSLVSSIDQRLDQNVLRNLLSLSEMIDPKVYPHSFKEEFSSGFCCDHILAGRHNGHLRESVDEHKSIVAAMLSRRKARHVIHADGFPRSTRGRQRSVEALLLDGWFGNGAGSNVLPNILTNFVQ